jgi:fatty-acyl-CoA synthase
MTTVWNTPLTPLAFLRRSADVYPDKTAIVYGDRRHTYAEFAAEATRVAHALRGSGVEPGDRVAYLLPNIPEMLVAHFAVPLAGAVLVAINTRLSTEEVRYILDHAGCKVLVVDAALHPVVAPVAGELKTVEEIITVVDPASPGDGTGSGVTYDDLLAAPTRRCGGRSTTRTPRSRSTTRPAPRASPRASCTTTAAPT